MNAPSSESAPVKIRDDIAATHRRGWERIASPGTWWTGAERVAIAAEVRNAANCRLCRARKAALSPYTATGKHDSLGALPENVVEVIHRVRTDPGRLTHKWYKEIIASGLSEERYVEVIGVSAQSTAMDTFAHGIGAAPAALPAPRAGEPTKKRPKGAKHSGAWVPWIQPADATDEERALGMFPPGRNPANIYKSMSLVPSEAVNFFDIVEVQYLPGAAMRDFAREFRAITHEQIELVAGRVSNINGCEY